MNFAEPASQTLMAKRFSTYRAQHHEIAVLIELLRGDAQHEVKGVCLQSEIHQADDSQSFMKDVVCGMSSKRSAWLRWFFP